MSYAFEHKKMKPVLDLASKLDVATNIDLDAIFDPLHSGFNIWCTPENNPGGVWNKINMISGAFCKPCSFLGIAQWKWAEGKPEILGVELTTSAYDLADQRGSEFNTNKRFVPSSKRQSIFNRKDDIEWCKRKINDLFEKAGMPIPAIFVGN